MSDASPPPIQEWSSPLPSTRPVTTRAGWLTNPRILAICGIVWFLGCVAAFFIAPRLALADARYLGDQAWVLYPNTNHSAVVNDRELDLFVWDTMQEAWGIWTGAMLAVSVVTVSIRVLVSAPKT